MFPFLDSNTCVESRSRIQEWIAWEERNLFVEKPLNIFLFFNRYEYFAINTISVQYRLISSISFDSSMNKISFVKELEIDFIFEYHGFALWLNINSVKNWLLSSDYYLLFYLFDVDK